MICISGPGHGHRRDLELLPGTNVLFRAFSFAGQLGSHCTPEVPGSIHEGSELGYSVAHAFGAAFDNPDLIVMSTFRLFSPDENASNRLLDVYDASLKTWMAKIIPDDADATGIAPDGRVMEILSEHTLVGYLLAGRSWAFQQL